MATRNKDLVRNKQNSIPTFTSREEEAAFWDTHDMSDYWEELQPVKLKVSKNLSQGITVRFDAETLAQLREYAHRKGLGPTTLVRMWILERLHHTE